MRFPGLAAERGWAPGPKDDQIPERNICRGSGSTWPEARDGGQVGAELVVEDLLDLGERAGEEVGQGGEVWGEIDERVHRGRVPRLSETGVSLRTQLCARLGETGYPYT